ncbi:hypothetical protein [Salipiger mucosus]|uniref:Uncharacterized protein n=1 Tax=Salipiger mucosus DSM 16094 TaxID=1123237 RepID=S9QYS9_9RHOB|nr:hypothetical protein [Salipiger mucosus]EPX84747.1 hypothetical protein Salmuc_01320 [Salipiger mucosus DSM 16094]
MGIRMHLAMGYGLDLGEAPFLDSARLDIDHLEEKALFDLWESRTLAFARTSGELMEKMIFKQQMAESLADMVVFDAEFGLEDKVLLQPAGTFRRWSRYGDLLDAYAYEAETGIDPENQIPTWTPVSDWLHPYRGFMVPDPSTEIGIRKIEDYGLTEVPEEAVPWVPWHLFFLIQTIFDLDHAETVSTFLTLRPHIYRYQS